MIVYNLYTELIIYKLYTICIQSWKIFSRKYYSNKNVKKYLQRYKNISWAREKYYSNILFFFVFVSVKKSLIIYIS